MQQRYLNLPSLALFSSMALLVGCGAGVQNVNPIAAASGIKGTVYGGATPIYGATIQLYEVLGNGDGTAAKPLLAQTVTTGPDGSFSLDSAGTPLFSCGGVSDEVYLTATGGNPGIYSANSAIALMTALGPCTSLTTGTTIVVNELTTVAAVEAMSQWMTSYTNVGVTSFDSEGETTAQTLANEFANSSTGASPGVNVQTGYTVPSAELNTLADIVEACVNSAGGVAGDGSPCGNLFSLTTPSGGTAPTNTVSAMLNLANNFATFNTSGLFGLVPPGGPFQPTLTTAPSSFAVGLIVPVGAVTVGQQSVTSITSPAIVYPGASYSFGGVVSGVNAVDFAITNCSSSTSGCSMKVTFSPKATGSRAAVLKANWSESQYSWSILYLLEGTGQ